MIDKSLWIDAFEAKIKTKAFEQFTLLMFDFETATTEQSNLLSNILFQNHLLPESWERYIRYNFSYFGQKRLHLQRLINKALELLEEREFSQNLAFLQIHILSTNLKSSDEEKSKYFQNILFKREIGRNHALLFLEWAKVAPREKSSRDPSLFHSKQILEQGVILNAQPVGDLTQILFPNGNEEIEDTTKITSTAELKQLFIAVQKNDDQEFAPEKKKSQKNSSNKSHKAADVLNSDSSNDFSDNATIKVPTMEVKEILDRLPKRKLENDIDKESFYDLPRKKAQVEPSSTGRSKNQEEESCDYRSRNIFQKSDRYFLLNGKSYFKMNTIGKGGSSTVFKVISASEGCIYALKTIDLSNHVSNGEDDEVNQIFESQMNEVHLLRKLKNSSPFIIELIDYQIFHVEKKIAILLELGDIDLAKLLSRSGKSNEGAQQEELDPIFVRLLWKEMLLAVDHIHENRIVHGDLKPANFVFVKGHIKLIDFGIAKSFSADTTNIYRDSQIGTINYMAPEAISPDFGNDTENPQKSGMRIGRASDVWSLGCILYQMIYGKPPFAALNTIQKLVAIPNLNHEILYPSHSDYYALETIKGCLQRNPRLRASIRGERGLLNKEFLKFQSDGKNTQIDPKLSFAKSLLKEEAFKSLKNDNDLRIVQNWIDSLSLPIISEDRRNDAEEAVPFERRPLQPIRSTSFNTNRALPTNLKEEIAQSENRLIPIQSSEANAKASKWMKASNEVAADMKSILEKRMVQMRKFLDVDQDNSTATESLNISSFYNQI